MFEKWFGDLSTNMIALLEQPLKEDLETLEMLQTRYQDTLDSLEEEAIKLEQELKPCSRMVVTTNEIVPKRRFEGFTGEWERAKI